MENNALLGQWRVPLMCVRMRRNHTAPRRCNGLESHDVLVYVFVQHAPCRIVAVSFCREVIP